MGSGRGPREGDAIAKQVASVGFVEKKEGASPPHYLKKELTKYRELSKCFSTPN